MDKDSYPLVVQCSRKYKQRPRAKIWYDSPYPRIPRVERYMDTGFYRAVARFMLVGMLAVLIVWASVGCSNQPAILKGNGEHVKLTNNSLARDRPWQEVVDFLNVDTTDKEMPSSERGSAYFAEMLHNRAEYRGFRTAFVVVEFEDGQTHALNAFNTVDYGIVYIDCTGQGTFDKPPPEGIFLRYRGRGAGIGETLEFPTFDSWDKVAYLAEGQKMGFVSVMPASTVAQGGIKFSYEWYVQSKDHESWEKLLSSLRDLVDAYNNGSYSGMSEQGMWDFVSSNFDLWAMTERPFNWKESDSKVAKIRVYW
jgi:hypothetical protein